MQGSALRMHHVEVVPMGCSCDARLCDPDAYGTGDSDGRAWRCVALRSLCCPCGSKQEVSQEILVILLGVLGHTGRLESARQEQQ